MAMRTLIDRSVLSVLLLVKPSIFFTINFKFIVIKLLSLVFVDKTKQLQVRFFFLQ